ncbi:hypothetical protein G4B88_007519 [Cannabis sativa]|uniref:Ubiquitin-like protease family profile domain-containing protein n=1 Tax=Cannabis sativa TaxID=3483 RepID=A0A7J6H9M0_CANSA|nr:hypothetical protein G4B88_007519 [Cannabis sativa]
MNIKNIKPKLKKNIHIPEFNHKQKDQEFHRVSLSLNDFFSGDTTPDVVKFKVKGGSKSVGQPGLMGASSSSAHENVSRLEFEELKKDQQGILMKSVAEMNKKLDILIESSHGGHTHNGSQSEDALCSSENEDDEDFISEEDEDAKNEDDKGDEDHEDDTNDDDDDDDDLDGAGVGAGQDEAHTRDDRNDEGVVVPESDQYQVVEENIDVDATIASAVKAVENLIGSSTYVSASVETSEKNDLEMRLLFDVLKRGIGRKELTTTNVYCKGKDTIFSPFRFGVEDISNKMWFHNLAYHNCFLTNFHIDIIFYYLRKKIMYSAEPEPKIKVTTTDYLFCSSITSLYEKFVEKKNDISVLSLSHNVTQYICGGKILCATPWHLVDHVVMPINVKLQDHWICGRLNIAERWIYLYNSLRSGRYMTAAKEACKSFSVILPYYFSMLDFKGLRNESKFSTMELFPIVVVDGLPEQVTADCGVFVASFAEYFIDGKPIPSSGFDVKIHRDRLAVLFYHYGMKKQLENIESESEAPPSLPKK